MEALTPWLETEGLVLGYAKRRVTSEPLSLKFHAPGITVLLGLNGAGKTTFLKSLLGEPVVEKGTLRIFGQAKLAGGDLGYVNQDPAYPAHLQLEDALRLAFLPKLGWFGRLSNEQRTHIDLVLKQFGLAGLRNRALSALSPGERQRAFLARTLLQRPKLLLLDEPTNHLDPHGQHLFWNEVKSIVLQTQCRVLVSTHDLAFAKKSADWVTAFKEGRVIYHGAGAPFWSTENVASVFGVGVSH